MTPTKEPATTTSGAALFQLGFRPFYLLAAAYAAVALPAWIAMLEGGLAVPQTMQGILWHQHELVFGFVLAVIAGFLLTAGRVWTGLPTPAGASLAALTAHWLAARVLVFTGPAIAAAAIDGSFAFVLAAIVGRVTLTSRNSRNYFVVVLLAGIGAANLVFHVAQLGIWTLEPALGVRLAMVLELALVLVMAGRVVPAFTGSALPGTRITLRPRLDRVSIALSVLVLGADAVQAWAWLVAPGALVAAALHVVRQSGWAPIATRGRPILWSLHLAHAWFPAGFVLLALAAMGIVSRSVAVHALAVGAIAGMIMAMITRTALGHTARPLAAGIAETASYVLIHVAAASRVLAGMISGSGYHPVILASAIAWSAAFAIYVLAYAPRLYRPRMDGRPG